MGRASGHFWSTLVPIGSPKLGQITFNYNSELPKENEDRVGLLKETTKCGTLCNTATANNSRVYIN